MPTTASAPHARTTVVRPSDPTLQPALRLALAFASIKLLLHIAANLWQAHIGWGYFRDEFYYIACGRHLAWGYVDHGPLVALQSRLAETLFGHSLAGLRLLSAAAGAARILLTGLLAWSLGGRRPAQALAMIAVLVAPQYLGTDGYLSMNSFESLFWMSCLLALILAQRRLAPESTAGVHHPSQPHRDRWDVIGQQSEIPIVASSRSALRTPWILFGLSAGLGLLNKPSMTFFLLALGAALLLTPARRLLLNRHAALGIAILVLIASPNLLWQMHNGWPTLEFLRNGRAEGKNISLAPPAFLLAQVNALHPLNILVWIPGLYTLLFGALAKRWRWLGLTYLLFITGMMLLHAKDYYCTPIYPILFAAGGIAWENRFARTRAVGQNRTFAFPVLESALLLSGLLILPMAIPVLRPETWLTYTKAMHLYGKSGNTETFASGPLPQFFADRFGWQEEVNLVLAAYRSLPPSDRQRVCIFTSNYGEAGAIDFLGPPAQPGLPPALSGQNTYWLWGTHGCDPNLVIAVIRDTPEQLLTKYQDVDLVGRMNHPLSMPFEHRGIYLLRNRRPTAPFNWKDERFYF